jgi:hypothetical protein
LEFHSGREADHSPPSSAEIKEWVELYLHSRNAPSWCGAQLGGAQGQIFDHPEGLKGIKWFRLGVAAGQVSN